MKFDKELWEKVTEYHGHKCPGIAMGFKMCEAAILEMDANPSEDEIVCISENKTCPVDAVRFIFGCTEDNQGNGDSDDTLSGWQFCIRLSLGRWYRG